MDREDSRISIDTMTAWTRVKSNYSNAVLSTLEKELAAQGLSSDSALRKYMDKYIQQTVASAQPNLRVNGQSFDDKCEPDLEPFDEALDRHVWSLHDHRLAWHKSIAITRRADPQAIEKSITGLCDQDRQVEAANPVWMDVDDDIPLSDTGDLDADFGDGLFKATAWAEELAQSIPSQKERSERLKTVAAEISKLDSR